MSYRLATVPEVQMTCILLVAMAGAADLEGPMRGPAGAVDRPAPDSLGASRPGSDKSDSDPDKSKSQGTTSGTFFKKGRLWGWTYRPYVAPGGGLTIGNGGTAITAGVDVGVTYSKKKWRGDLSAGGAYTTGSNLSGYDVHLGNDFGRREKWWGLSLGVLGFYNGYVGETAADPSLEPAFGVDVPLELVLGPKKYYAWGSVTPSFIFNEDRHVAGLPFGDELEWGAGVGLRLKWVTAQAGFKSRITTVGVINTPTLTLSFTGQE